MDFFKPNSLRSHKQTHTCEEQDAYRQREETKTFGRYEDATGYIKSFSVLEVHD